MKKRRLVMLLGVLALIVVLACYIGYFGFFVLAGSGDTMNDPAVIVLKPDAEGVYRLPKQAPITAQAPYNPNECNFVLFEDYQGPVPMSMSES